ncbi:MAG: Gldg family protein [Acetobacter sp.]|nr:Gldg family protein [Acetobacter sp.]
MKQFLAQYRKEFSTYFSGYNAYLLIPAYYLLSFFSALYLGDYFLRVTNVMNAYFIMQPTVLVLIIPAITMRIWSEEIKSGTIELLLTQPIRYSTLVLAKFCAAYMFFLLLVLSSLPVLIITNALSVLDWGIVFSTYLGLILCGALFTAIGCFISVCCKGNITSFVCTVAILFFILQLNFTPINLPNEILPLDVFNFSGNYSAFLAGTLIGGNIVYFILATCLILWLNVVMLLYQQRKSKQDIHLFYLFICLLTGIFILGNLSSFFLFDRLIDVTDNKIYTLSKNNQKFLNSYEKRIDITLYEAKTQRENGNSHYAAYAAYVEQLLRQIERHSLGSVRFSVVRVEAYSELERRLIREKIPYEENQLGDKIYMALDLTDNNGNFRRINSLSSLRENLLETDIMRLIRLFGHEKKNIAVLASQNQFAEMQGFHNFLNEFYELTFLNDYTRFIPSSYDAVILVNPTDVTSELLLALDQYILNGGNLIFFYEPSLTDDYDNSYIKDFLYNYGIKLISTNSILDDDSALGIAKPSNNEEWKDILTVLVNNAGEVKTRESVSFTAVPILKLNDSSIAVHSQGLYSTNYPTLAAETSELLSSSVKKGQVFFFYDSDLLKDYLYINEYAKGNGFYQIVSFSDNLLFFLRLMDKATDSHTEDGLDYHHYPMNLLSIGQIIYNLQHKTYYTRLTELEEKIASIKNILSFTNGSSVKNIKKISELTQELEEIESQYSSLNRLITSNYQTAISSLTFFILLFIPGILVGLLFLFIRLYRKYKLSQIRRIM